MKAPAPVPESIDAYIAICPAPVRPTLQKLRLTISRAAPTALEEIKYRMPTFVLGENLVHFAAFARHIGFYPAPSAIARFKDRLSAYKWAKGSVQFPLDKPLPFDLVADIVKFRVEEVTGRKPRARKGIRKA